MAPPPIKVRGAGRSKGIPPGYILGRSSAGNGDVELLSVRDFRRVGIASRADLANIQLAFTQLIDVPQDYTAAALKTVRVNAAATGLEFVSYTVTSTTLTITGSGTAAVTVEMPLTGVIAGPYTNANITVDGRGRITAAANGTTPSQWIPLVTGSEPPVLVSDGTGNLLLVAGP